MVRVDGRGVRGTGVLRAHHDASVSKVDDTISAKCKRSGANSG